MGMVLKPVTPGLTVRGAQNAMPPTERRSGAEAALRSGSQSRFGLRQPQGHIHGAVEIDGNSQGGTGLRPTARLAVHCAETAVAVRLERTHAQFFGQD